eukprot:TRINITY_DN47415_c0_g1_i1.p1 TRINITY_DN47415_c0_g1~~TRINITY_DN47415_c0_g1_i1.p1  ORF type:complete len:262 (+),score=55.02 TRINITY_DN47415_c0_g1_i1:69-854(+)
MPVPPKDHPTMTHAEVLRDYPSCSSVASNMNLSGMGAAYITPPAAAPGVLHGSQGTVIPLSPIRPVVAVGRMNIRSPSMERSARHASPLQSPPPLREQKEREMRDMLVMSTPTNRTPREVRDVVSPSKEVREAKKMENIGRLQALQAIEERRRYEEIDRRLKTLEAEQQARQEDVFRDVNAQISQQLSILQAEVVALRATVEFQGEEIIRLNGMLTHQNEQQLKSPSPTISNQDRSDPNWLHRWQEQINIHHHNKTLSGVH